MIGLSAIIRGCVFGVNCIDCGNRDVVLVPKSSTVKLLSLLVENVADPTLW